MKNLFVLILFSLVVVLPALAQDETSVLRSKAEQGDAEAQLQLGAVYAKGYGVPKDLAQAHMWFNLSGAKGSELAKHNLETLEKQMSAEQKAEAMKLARDRWTKANP